MSTEATNPGATRLDVAEARAVGMTIAFTARQAPDRMAIRSAAGDLTFGELNARANRLVRALRARGLAAGDGVALLCSNRPEFAEVYAASGGEVGMTAANLLFVRACQLIEGIHPMQGGLFRRKYRHDRRPGLPVESPWVFYPRYAGEIGSKTIQLLALAWRIGRIYLRVRRDPRRHEYRDLALTPVEEADLQDSQETLPIGSAAE